MTPSATPVSPADRSLIDTLAAALKKHGHDWCGDPRRCHGMLSDLLAARPLDVKILVDAVEAGVVRDLAGSDSILPMTMRIERWIHRLHDAMAMREDMACRAVGVWAVALGVTDAMPTIGRNPGIDEPADRGPGTPSRGEAGDRHPAVHAAVEKSGRSTKAAGARATAPELPDWDGCGPCSKCRTVINMTFDAAVCPICGNQMSWQEAFHICGSYPGTLPRDVRSERDMRH